MLGSIEFCVAWFVLVFGLMLLEAFLQRLGAADNGESARKVGVTPVRGEGLVSEADAALRADAARAKDLLADFPGIPFGSARLPASAFYYGFLIKGAPGSGKTATLEHILSVVLRSLMGRPEKTRCVLFDPKGEWPSKLFARLPGQCPLYLTNPFDARSCRVEFGEDFRDRSRLYQFAAALVPEQKNDQNRFFTDAARAVVLAILTALAHYGTRWRLGDVVYFSRGSRERLRALLDLSPESRDAADRYLGARAGRDVLATVEAFLGRFSAVAACWDRADRGVSLSTFMDESAALVLGHDPRASFAIKQINRLVVKSLTDLAIARQGQDNRTLFAFDEFRQFGSADGLIDVAIQGRSSGACLLVASQDFNGVEEVLGPKLARELWALLQNQVHLKAGSPEAARVCSEMFGKQEVHQTTGNTSATTNHGAASPASHTTSHNTQVTLRDVVLPSEVQGLPLADPIADRLAAFLRSPVTGGFRYEGPFVAALRALPTSTVFPNLVPRPAEHQVLRPRDREDLVRLGLPPTPELLRALRVT